MNGAWLLVILLALAGLSLLSWSISALDVPGAVGAFVIGLGVALSGTLGWLVLMATFTVISVFATKYGQQRKEQRKAAEARKGERGLPNVMANGLAALIMALMVPFVGIEIAAVAFAAAVAAVTADTLASEIGALASRARLIIPPFEQAQAGRNGGVSWLGQFAAASGAATIGLLSVWLLGLSWQHAWMAAGAGFIGCQIDSILGATMERDDTNDRPLTKESVNFFASVVPASAVLLILWLT